jgi:hypothetical protein
MGKHLRHTARLIGYAAYLASPESRTATAAYPGSTGAIQAIADSIWTALFPGREPPAGLPDLPEGESLHSWRTWQVVHGLDAGWQAAAMNRPLGTEGEEDKISQWKLRTGRLNAAATRNTVHA